MQICDETCRRFAAWSPQNGLAQGECGCFSGTMLVAVVERGTTCGLCRTSEIDVVVIKELKEKIIKNVQFKYTMAAGMPVNMLEIIGVIEEA